MNLTKKFIPALLVLLIFNVSKIFSQDGLHSHISQNTPLQNENITADNSISADNKLLILEKMHKKASEMGDYSKASAIQEEMYKLIPENDKYVTQYKDAYSNISKNIQEPEQMDWMTNNSLVHPYSTKQSPVMHKQLEIKCGEDNCLYAVVNCATVVSDYGSIYFYRSTDFGITWNTITAITETPYIGNISFLVESKLNSNPDSTRLIIFYTESLNSNNDDAYLNFYSVRANGTGNQAGTIATPAPGARFTHISAVSDGAFWQSATYMGVVGTVTDNATGNTLYIKFFRSIDWCATWVGSTLSTAYNDFYPSADYKEGSSDSVYIAVERKLSPSHTEIRLLATPWSPSSSFNMYFLTSSVNSKYENPYLTIKQNSPADSILITCTKDGSPVYHFTPNGGGLWNIDYVIGTGNNKIFTSCSSAPGGTAPFSVCWVSNDGDSLNVRRGVLGNLGNTIYKVNNHNCITQTVPSCVTIPLASSGSTAVLYPAQAESAYVAVETSKLLSVKIVPQGFYNPNTNRLNMRDTLKIFIRNQNSPYNVIDSGKAILDSVSLSCNVQFNALSDGQYYISVNHRNSIETWSSSPVNLSGVGTFVYDFTSAASKAYGNNEIQVDTSPLTYAMYSGDVYNEGHVNLTDIVITFNDQNSFVTGYVPSDVTGDRITNLTDLILVYNNSTLFAQKITP